MVWYRAALVDLPLFIYFTDSYSDDDELMETLTPEVEMKRRPKPSVSQSKLVYCPTCKKSWKYVARKTPKICEKCKTAFQYQCEKCNRLYRRVDALTVHVTSQCIQLLSCSQCDFKTEDKTSLEQHVLLAHTKPGRYQCQRCGRGYEALRYLQSHMSCCKKDKPDGR
ncbi:zinc finger Y-chromosomal protein 1-like [Phymastichus coffea]|uniref:zinc finger Y-chromosomal protein 1-like n=1 Tax=Phymastichus coffea TaxID=108790 RepID=UPI00273C10AF|nr:zinc finger Y-chromosomal protein 1-like [Phymastichus coffea]